MSAGSAARHRAAATRRGPAFARIAIAAAPLVLLWPALRSAVESRMAWHMLLEFPLLLAAGWAARRWLAARPTLRPLLAAIEQLDWRGWTGAAFASAVAMFWMIPSALDAALLVPQMAALKFASWWCAGFLLAGSWPRLDPEPRLFFAGNGAWVGATAGLLYLDAPQRLCANYLLDDQRHAGLGLLLAALLLGGLALMPRRPSTTRGRGVGW